MVQVANRLHVAVTPVFIPGVRGAASPEERLIIYSPSGYAPRDEFTVAHELIELHLPAPVAALPAEAKERFCDRGAAALLLPRQQFLFSLQAARAELPELRRRWPWASWGAIAARLVDLVPGTAAATWVGNNAAWHRHDGSIEYYRDMRIPEMLARERARDPRRSHAVVIENGVEARAWRLVARHGRRVTLTVTRKS